MRNNRLFKYIKALPSVKQKRLIAFITSPYYNKNKKIVSLFKAMLKQSTSTTKTDLFKAIFPNGQYNDQIFKNLLTQGMKLFQQFLAAEFHQREEHQMQLSALKEAKSLQNQDLVEFKGKQLLNKMENSVFNEYSYFLQFELNKVILSKEEIQLNPNNAKMLVLTIDKFYQYTALEYLKQYCYILNFRATFNENNQLELLELIFNHFSKHKEHLVNNPTCANSYDNNRFKIIKTCSNFFYLI